MLLDDRYDVWKVAADGSEAKMLTGGLGRKTHTGLCRPVRPVRRATDETRARHRSDQAAAAEGRQRVHARRGLLPPRTGRDEPKLLVMGARAYGTPVKAKDADTLPADGLDFYDYPGLLRHRRRLPRVQAQ